MNNKDFVTNHDFHERRNSVLSNLSDFYYNDRQSGPKTANLKVIHLDKNNADTKTNLLDKTETNEEKNDLKGFITLVFSVFMYSLSNLISKYLAVYHPDLENLTVNLIRGLYLMILSYLFIYYNKIDYIEQIYRDKFKTKLLIIRCSFGASSNILLFEAFKYMRISSAFTIFCTYPIFVSILSVVYLKSKFTNFDVVSYLACIISVIFISKPAFIFTDNSDDNDSLLGVFISFSAAITNAVGVCINKSIAFDFDFMVSTFLFGVFFFLESAILLPFTVYGISTLNFTNFIWSSLLSCIFFVGLSTFILALNIGNPVKILPGTYFGIVFSLIYNTFIFEKPTDFLDIRS